MQRISAALGLVLLSGISAHAQGLQAVRPLPGYVCMQLALSPEQLTDPKVGVPIRAAPSRSAPVAAYAANTMIVVSPQEPTSGYLRVLRVNGEMGWIEAGYLRPWKNPYVPSARCVPSIMSDGKPGFG